MTDERMKSDAAPLSSGQLIGMLTLSWLIAGALLTALVNAGGIWNLLANSRLLSLLIETGVVRYHDKQIGPIQGVPELKYYLASQDPVAWIVVLVAALLMLGYWAMKSIQFHAISSAMGMSGSVGDHTRAYLYGMGLNRWLPFQLGDIGTAMVLRGEGGQPDEKALGSVHLSNVFVLFEILFFGAIGLLLLGWGVWIGQIFWPLVILGLAFLIVRRGDLSAGVLYWQGLRKALSWLLERPLLFFMLGVLSVLAFLFEHVAVYALSQAFTSQHVIINIEFSVFLMALVAGSIARLIPVTPGGIGQFEWGFAVAIYLSGTGMPEAVTIALLFAVLRYSLGGLVSLVLRLAYVIPISIRDLFASVRLG